MNVEFLMAARARIVYQGQKTLLGAMLGKPDSDSLVQSMETAEQKFRGGTSKQPLDAIEILIAEEVDNGNGLPVSNPEAFLAASWLAQGDLASLPDPIPRAFVLYLAKAWTDAGHFSTLTAALTEILTTRKFV